MCTCVPKSDAKEGSKEYEWLGSRLNALRTKSVPQQAATRPIGGGDNDNTLPKEKAVEPFYV